MAKFTVHDDVVNFETIRFALEHSTNCEVQLELPNTKNVLCIKRGKCHFREYKRANNISVFYVENNGICRFTIGGEYYNERQIEKAVNALKLRYNNTVPKNPSGLSFGMENLKKQERQFTISYNDDNHLFYEQNIKSVLAQLPDFENDTIDAIISLAENESITVGNITITRTN